MFLIKCTRNFAPDFKGISVQKAIFNKFGFLLVAISLLIAMPAFAQHNGHNHNHDHHNHNHGSHDGHNHGHNHNHNHGHSHGHNHNHDHHNHNHGSHDGHNHGAHAANTAADKSHDASEEEFDVNAMIMHHIADANHFELMHGVGFPLPCILYNQETGALDMFMSSKLNDHKEHKGYIMHHGQVQHAKGQKFIDFSITKNVMFMLIASILLCVLFVSIAGAYKKRKGQAPKGLQSFFEPLVNFVIEDIAKPNIGHKYMKFVPFLCTVFFFILILNLLGLIPFIGNPNVSGNIAVTVVLSLFTFILITINANKDYWMHILWPPGVPIFVKPILIIVEFAGIFIKPIALAIRLFANISGGHIIILSLVSLIFIFGKMGASLSGATAGTAIAIPFVLFMNCIELLVAFLQAYIFTMLSALFIGQAVEEHHH